jgi:hypothetical protein
MIILIGNIVAERPDIRNPRSGIKPFRHCERSEAIHRATKKEWIASSLCSSQ